MKKFFLTIIIFALTLSFASAQPQKNPPQIKGMHYITIPAGIFLQAVIQSEISTKTNNLNDPVRAIIPVNFYMTNTICIPQNSILDGSVSEFALPKKGRDGILKVHFTKITFPNDTSCAFNADLWMDGSDMIGGKPSELDSFQEIPFSVQGLSPGYILMKPTGEYKIGRHMTLSAGSETIIKVNDGVRLNFME